MGNLVADDKNRDAINRREPPGYIVGVPFRTDTLFPLKIFFPFKE